MRRIQSVSQCILQLGSKALPCLLQNGWNLVSLLVLFFDLLRLHHWPFYMERAVRMLSSLRALRIVVLSAAMQALLGALANSMKAIAALALLSMPPLRPGNSAQ